MKRYVLFDLDGTLTDSSIGIANSVVYMLKYFGIEVDNRESLRAWMGPPLVDSMQLYYGFDRKKALQGVEKYREYFNEKGMYENLVYSGIIKMLSGLKEKGYGIYMATSKPETAARRIAEYFDFAGYFDYIGGASDDDSRTKKGDVIRYVLETAGITEKDAAVMVGDREHDVIGAKENGLETIGVLYGYGSRGELEDAGAEWIVESVEALELFLFDKF